MSSQKAKGIDTVPGTDENHKKAVLELRRVLISALVGGTPKSNPSVDRVLETEYLLEVKNWLEEILKDYVGMFRQHVVSISRHPDQKGGSPLYDIFTGGVDMLLHLLKNIAELPVTTSMVKQSGLGKLVGSIEKHRICSGPNAGNIQERIELVKSSWKASVKARKIAEGSSQPALKITIDSKRPVPETSSAPSPSAKRAKVSDSPAKSSSSLSSLLTKMTASSKQGQTNGVKADAAKTTWESNNSVSPQATHKKKKTSVRVKWADHFGGDLAESRLIEGENIAQEPAASTESWSDRKKRDREKEKKLLLTMKKAKLLDEDDEDLEPAVPGMKATVGWKTPALLLELPDVPKPQLNSTQVTAQNQRNQTVTAAIYSTDNNVPSSPAPLSDIEQAIDMTAQSSAIVAKMPFFASHQAEAAAPAPTNEIARQYQPEYAPPPPEAAPPAPAGATLDFVQTLGLPLFLVGQDTQALQTLASSPGLLNSFVDSTGMYDQARLLSLVQTLTGAPAPPPAAPPAMYPPHVPPAAVSSPYRPGGGYPSYPEPSLGGSKFANPLRPPTGLRNGGDEGNLHVSGYGPMTTQADLIALFSPFVVVNEVVMKGTFAFVNTSDPVNAQRAREALTGSIVGGQPIRINQAQRKGRESGPPSRSNFPTHSPYGPAGGAPTQNFPFAAPGAPPNPPPPPQLFQPQPTSVDDVRDSRGNAPTKNLFVAGYGPGTSEAQMRQIFSQHCNVVGVVLKGNFTFVNTGSREDAVKAREMLQGNVINGGPLRINFAKETGRLGTSFDLTYNQQSGPNGARRPPNQPQLPPPVSYYGRN
eukprot:scaffold212_cov173-Amphora_coffeaeformis.AAC.1